MMLLTTAIAVTAAAEAIIIITLCGVVRLSIRENVKLVRGVARSKNQSVFAEIYNSNEDRPHKKHVSLAAQQEKSMQSGGDE